MTLDAKIEAILFYKGEPTSITLLAKILSTTESTILEELASLESNLINRGLVLLRLNNEVALGTAPEASNLIESFSKEELERDLSKASLETLAIILYRSPISRAQIEYIRGIQSSFILRSLSIRGLILRIDNPRDQRGFLYTPTVDLLKHLGIKSLDEMPEYEVIQKKLREVNGDSQTKSDM